MEEAGPFERLLTVVIPDAEFESAKNRAARRLSRDLKVKGFRPGKAPRRLVESMVGAERVREEALQEALPGIVGSALEEAEIDPAVAPSVSATRDVEDGIEVDITVTLWPKLARLPEYAGRRMVVDTPEADEDEIDAQVDRVRSQYAELEDVSRPAQEGDFVMIDLGATKDGVAVDEASATDLLYEVGSRSFIPGLDEPLLGSSAGDIKQIETQLPDGFGDHGGEMVQLRILVKGVRARRLPELSDEWVAEVSEFETVEELRDQLAESILAMKRVEAATELRNRLIDELTSELDLALPEALVDAEMDNAAHRLVHRLEASGIDLGNYLRITGQDEQAFLDDLRGQAEQNLRTRILLESIAEAEGLTVEEEDLDEVVGQFAAAANEPADEYRKQLERTGQVIGLAGDILRQKAFDHLVASVTAIGADGSPVDLDGPGADDESDEPDGDGESESAKVEETE